MISQTSQPFNIFYYLQEPYNEAEKELKITDCLFAVDGSDECSCEGDDEDIDIVKRMVMALVDTYLRKLEERNKIKRSVII